MNGEDLGRELASRGLKTQAQAARALVVSQATVSRWLSEDSPIPGWVDVALKAIRRRAKRAGGTR